MQPLHNLILALAFAASPASVELPTERVDLIEVEHVYDRDGRHMFDQILARSWERATGEAEIREYRITKKPSDYPVERDGAYVVPWAGANVPRRVIAPHMVETWHQSDGEVCERKRWPVDAKEVRVALSVARMEADKLDLKVVRKTITVKGQEPRPR